jgi:hypothetical protein
MAICDIHRRAHDHDRRPAAPSLTISNSNTREKKRSRASFAQSAAILDTRRAHTFTKFGLLELLLVGSDTSVESREGFFSPARAQTQNVVNSICLSIPWCRTIISMHILRFHRTKCTTQDIWYLVHARQNHFSARSTTAHCINDSNCTIVSFPLMLSAHTSAGTCGPKIRTQTAATVSGPSITCHIHITIFVSHLFERHCDCTSTCRNHTSQIKKA